MKEFDKEKFCNDLQMLRGKETQQMFASKLGINRSTLSLLEHGKQIPTLDILTRFCNLSKKNIDDYFVDVSKNSLIFLMGSLKEEDKIKIEEMAERIRIKEKYELLAKRSNYVID